MSIKLPVTVNAVRRAMLTPHGLPASIGWTAVAVIVPTAIRYILSTSANAVPFVTYYPAIMLAGLFLGWRYGVLTALLCAGVARLLFLQQGTQHAATHEVLAILGMFALSCTVLLGTAHALRQSLIQFTAAGEREELLNAELRHRLKNLLAVVGSLITLSRRHADPEHAHEALNERIIALSRAIDLLGTDGPLACALPDLAEEALRPFLTDYDIRLTGPKCAVDRNTCVPAVLALHELATNAIKYGALTTPGGWVELSWSGPAHDTVQLNWSEHGGPPVERPARRGMGSKILSMRSDVSRFALEFTPAGVTCSIALKAAPAI